MTNFSVYSFKEFINKTLTTINFVTPTTIQKLVIPQVLKGHSLIGRGETGSGKTHAFLLPIMEKINTDNKSLQAVIICPTRELATQIYKRSQEFVKHNPSLVTKLIVGGLARKQMAEELVDKTIHLVVATPGRLNDLALKQGLINIGTVKMLVVDEADMTLEMGFLEEIDALASRMQDQLQMMVFSATIPVKLEPFLNKYMENPLMIEATERSVNPSELKHFLIPARHREVYEILEKIFTIINPYLCLIFANTKETVKQVYAQLNSKGYNIGIIHGDLEARERKRALNFATSGKYQYIICSDIAARGIDIPGISHVISIGLPNNLEFYLHRAGRTARAGSSGICYTIYSNEDADLIEKLQSLQLEFNHLDVTSSGFKELPQYNYRKIHPKKVNQELDKKIKTTVAKFSSKEVKPNYKKKLKVKIENVKRKHRRDVIKQEIKKKSKRLAIERSRGDD